MSFENYSNFTPAREVQVILVTQASCLLEAPKPVLLKDLEQRGKSMRTFSGDV